MIITDPAVQLIAAVGMGLSIMVCLVIMTGGIISIIYNVLEDLMP